MSRVIVLLALLALATVANANFLSLDSEMEAGVGMDLVMDTELLAWEGIESLSLLDLQISESESSEETPDAMATKLAGIHRVAANVTEELVSAPSSFEASTHAVLARYAADAARRAADSAKDFQYVSNLANDAALRAANSGPKPTPAAAAVSSKQALADAAAALAADPNNAAKKAELAFAQKAAEEKASAKVTALKAQLKKDPKNPALLAKLTKAKARLAKRKAEKRARKAAKITAAKAKVTKLKAKLSALKAALAKDPKNKKLLRQLARAQSKLKRNKAFLKKNKTQAKKKPVAKAKKAVKKAKAKIGAAKAALDSLKAAFKKNPKSLKLKMKLEKALQKLAAARAKMLKNFKLPKRKPFKAAKFLSGAKRDECKEQGPAVWYMNKYADVKKKVGTDKAAAFEHWCKRGKREGRASCFLKSCAKFDPFSKHCKKNPGKWYVNFYSDLKAAYGKDFKAAENHYWKHGVKEKRLNCFTAKKIAKSKKKVKPAAKSPKKRAAKPNVPLEEKELTDCEQDPTQFYLDTHQDINGWAGPFLRTLAKYHWCVWGHREGRANCWNKKVDCAEWNKPKENPTCLKDPLGWWGKANVDLPRAFGGNRDWYSAHFCRWGRREGRPHCFSDEKIEEMCKHWDSKQPECKANPKKWFVERWPHLKWHFGKNYEAGVEYFCHWGRHGGLEHCFDSDATCSPRYEPKSEVCKKDPAAWYLNAWSDLRHHFGKNKAMATEHWCKHGRHEGRRNCFESKEPYKKICARWIATSPKCKADPVLWYLKAYPDLTNAFGTNKKAGVRHYCEHGQREKRANCFKKHMKKGVCAEWDPKSARCKKNPAAWYVNYYPDLKAAFGKDGKKARKHYEKFGRSEGRANCFKKKKKKKAAKAQA